MATPVLTASGASSANNGTGNFDLSFTPSANKIYLYLACWLVDGNANANQQPGLTMSVPTGSGNLTATPTLVLLNDTLGDDTWETGCVVYKLQAAASPSGTSTIRLAPSLAVYQWQGFIVEVVDPDDTLANIVAQSAEGQTNTVDAGAATYSLAGSPTSGHTLISFAVYNDEPAGAHITPTTGWTELSEGSGTAYPISHIQWRDDTTSTTCTIPQNAASYGNANGITVELVTATGAVDLVPSDSVVTVVSDTGSVTQTHVLAPTDSVVTVVSDGGSITQTHALVGTDAVVAVVNDTGSITQTHALTGTDSTVVVVSDPGSITVQGVTTLAGIDSVITVVSDTGSVTQTHQIAPTDSVVIVVSDTGTVVAEGDSLIQMRSGELTARWNATRLDSRWEAPDLTTRWGASPLTE